VVSFMPRLLYFRGKSPMSQLDRKLVGPQGWSGRYREVKILDPTGTRTPKVVQLVASRCNDCATAALDLRLEEHYA
jgi:hypothetical protein